MKYRCMRAQGSLAIHESSFVVRGRGLLVLCYVYQSRLLPDLVTATLVNMNILNVICLIACVENCDSNLPGTSQHSPGTSQHSPGTRDCLPLPSAAFTSSDELEFAAIKAIHWHLDDNADGTVDFSESDKASRLPGNDRVCGHSC